MANAQTLGVHHVGFTVPNLQETRGFFVDVLGFEQVGEVADYPAVFVSDGTVMVTLWQASEPENAIPFDRKHNVGLHHVALRVRDDEALEGLHHRLRDSDSVSVEFCPEPLGGGPTQHMMCTIPGGIRVEFIAAGGSA